MGVVTGVIEGVPSDEAGERQRQGLDMFIDIDFVVAVFDNSMERKIEPAAKGSVLLDGSW